MENSVAEIMEDLAEWICEVCEEEFPVIDSTAQLIEKLANIAREMAENGELEQ